MKIDTGFLVQNNNIIISPEVLGRLNIGDVVRARVLEITANELLLKLLDGTVFTAATMSALDVKPGDYLDLRVKNREEGRLFLETVKNAAGKLSDADGEIKKQLILSGIKPDELGMNIAKAMKTENIRFNIDDFGRILDIVTKFRDMTPAKAVFLYSGNMKAEERNIRALKQLVDSRSKVGNELGRIAELLNTTADDETLGGIAAKLVEYEEARTNEINKNGMNRSLNRSPGSNYTAENNFAAESDYTAKNNLAAESDYTAKNNLAAKSDYIAESDYTAESDYNTESDNAGRAGNSGKTAKKDNPSGPGRQEAVGADMAQNSRPGSSSRSMTVTGGLNDEKLLADARTQKNPQLPSKPENGMKNNISDRNESDFPADSKNMTPVVLEKLVEELDMQKRMRDFVMLNMGKNEMSGKEAESFLKNMVPFLEKISPDELKNLTGLIARLFIRVRNEVIYGKTYESFTDMDNTVFDSTDGGTVELSSGNAFTAEQTKAAYAGEQTKAAYAGEQAKTAYTPEQAKDVIRKAFENLFIKIGSDTSGKDMNIKELYKDIISKLEIVKNNMNNTVLQGTDEITGRIDNLENNLRFINEVNSCNTYVQIPLNIVNRNTTGELYILKRDSRRKRIDAENATVLISLSTQNLGRIDSLVTLNKKNISVNIRVENKEIISFIKESFDSLYKRLAEKGYKLIDMKYRVFESEINLMNVSEVVSGEFENRNVSVDYRI